MQYNIKMISEAAGKSDLNSIGQSIINAVSNVIGANNVETYYVNDGKHMVMTIGMQLGKRGGMPHSEYCSAEIYGANNIKLNLTDNLTKVVEADQYNSFDNVAALIEFLSALFANIGF